MSVLDEHKNDIIWLRSEIKRLEELVERLQYKIDKQRGTIAKLQADILEDGL